VACRLLEAKTVIPMHFATFPALTGTPEQLRELVKTTKVWDLKPGETVSW